MDIASSSNSEEATVNNGDGDAGVSSTNSTDYDKELNGEVNILLENIFVPVLLMWQVRKKIKKAFKYMYVLR